MRHKLDEAKPIFIQIAEYITDGILNGTMKEGEKVPSTNQFAVRFQINPATAAKGINQLVDEKILFKKRGVGMFVAEDAKRILLTKHQEKFFAEYISPLLKEAKKLDLSTDEIISFIKKGDVYHED
ncbi:GntR family transcriptional regulator [Sporosarcina sp. G11-34]|uniref:GntR family transcriptional regulator n=1 Tax=Sporosarcina sp. G11-34 TaxID=2849605 RepID=UPI0022A9CC0D|nr:GntR family transcriptional regulator [Sporosarcina sp. G11-34]MCZ2259630.1 GntR family transcriptional regulator [Sporosarcina sp. G11-34]